MPPQRKHVPLNAFLRNFEQSNNVGRTASLAHPSDELWLDAFLGYVSTFFHRQPKDEMFAQMRAQRLLLPRARGRNPRSAPQLLPVAVQQHQGPRRLFHGSRNLRGQARNDVGPVGAFSPTAPRRSFHNYFVTHLPSSSLHPDSRPTSGPHHKLPRSASMPHEQRPGSSPAASPPNMPSRDLTVVRIPLRSAKHHFGAYNARGTRSYNEDTNQAGTIEVPAFAKKAPISLVRSAMANSRSTGEGIVADTASGDPQIFYFGVFDGHGGDECSQFLRDELHGYIEEAAKELGLESSLRKKRFSQPGWRGPAMEEDEDEGSNEDLQEPEQPEPDATVLQASASPAIFSPTESAPTPRSVQLFRDLATEYKDTVGGYFRRFRPRNFDLDSPSPAVTPEAVLTYAFLRADLDFITAQARKPDPDDPYVADNALNKDDPLGVPPHQPPSGHRIGGSVRFKGGSTASVALISTPTPAPFWHPAANSTLLVAHVGDTRILLCETATGAAKPLTVDHHPSAPAESRRLTRYAETLVTDSFGEERIAGLANSRAFGDMQSKRVGVSAEPDVSRVELGPAQYSFMVLVSDGVSGTLGDQEIVDVVKEAKTPEQGAKDVVDYATEVSGDGDNATCLVVRLGGWERRSEGGLGSLGTKEIRDARRSEALDPRRGRR